MKNLGLLIATAFFLTACNLKPGGNRAILPATHEGDKAQIETSKTVDESAKAAEVELDSVAKVADPVEQQPVKADQNTKNSEKDSEQSVDSKK